jgi:hypothetical protein
LPRSKRAYGILAAAIAIAIAAAGYAYTASNTVPDASLGQGANTISGYTISSVSYNTNASNPGNVDSVSFTISPAAAGTVKIQLAPAGSWYSCTNTSGSVSCATTSPQATATAATSLNVVAGA